MIRIVDYVGSLSVEDPGNYEDASFEVKIAFDERGLLLVLRALTQYAKMAEEFSELADAVDIHRIIFKALALGRLARRKRIQNHASGAGEE